MSPQGLIARRLPSYRLNQSALPRREQQATTRQGQAGWDGGEGSGAAHRQAKAPSSRGCTAGGLRRSNWGSAPLRSRDHKASAAIWWLRSCSCGSRACRSLCIFAPRASPPTSHSQQGPRCHLSSCSEFSQQSEKSKRLQGGVYQWRCRELGGRFGVSQLSSRKQSHSPL